MRRLENEFRFRSMKSDDDKRRTTRCRLYYALKKTLRGRRRWRRRQNVNANANANANVYGMTCNNAYALPKTTSDLCRQELMEKRLRASRFCCQARRVQVAPQPLSQAQSQQPPPAPSLPSQAAVASSAAPGTATVCPNCPATQQPRATSRGPALALSNGGLTRSLPCQALPPPPPCAPQCPPCPPCPPTLSTPLKASDYIHTTTECYPTNAKQDPCRWDNTSCYNEGNDASGNTIRQWNTRCQFASKLNEAGGGGGANNVNRGGGGGGGSILGGSGAVNAGAALSDSYGSDSNRRALGGRAAVNEPVCGHERCRAAAAVSEHCFRKCKKELTVHFPSGKRGTQLQLRRSAKLANLITPRPTTARPDIAATTTAAAAIAAGLAAAARSKLPVVDNNNNNNNDDDDDEDEDDDDLMAESPINTTRAPAFLASTPLTPMTPAAAAAAAAAAVHYRPLISLIDDDMPPLSVSHQHHLQQQHQHRHQHQHQNPAAAAAAADTSIFTNRASQLRWLQSQRKLYPAANKRSAIGSAEMMTPPLTHPTAAVADFYKNDFDWGRVRR